MEKKKKRREGAKFQFAQQNPQLEIGRGKVRKINIFFQSRGD